MIRRDDSDPCPFGLKIPFACKSAGNHIDNMAPLNILGEDSTEEEKAAIAKANNRLLIWALNKPEEISPCKYAGELFEDKVKAVECNFEDNAPGVGQESAIMSPSYSRNFDQPEMVGLFSYPLEYYNEFGGMQNGYYGAYSLQGSVTKEQLKKLADNAIKFIDKKKSNK